MPDRGAPSQTLCTEERLSVKTKYTATQILAMCDTPWMWVSQLYEAAKGMPGITSVTPINLVVQALRAKHRKSI